MRAGGISLAAACLLLAGCAERFVQAGVTSRQADTDLYACQRENRNFSDGSVVGPHGDFAQEDLIRQCMRARGYSSQR
jgi:hypothetical protein